MSKKKKRYVYIVSKFNDDTKRTEFLQFYDNYEKALSRKMKDDSLFIIKEPLL